MTRTISAGKLLPDDDPVLRSAAQRPMRYHATRKRPVETSPPTVAGEPQTPSAAFKNCIVKASKMHQLPEEHHKIIIRPRGALSLSKVCTTATETAVIKASSLTAEQVNEDVVCPNFTPNIVVVSTPEPDNEARKQFDVCFYCGWVGQHSDVCQRRTLFSVEDVEPSTHQRTTSALTRASSVEEATPLETKRAGSVFKYPMWYGPTEGNATGRNRPRRRPWRRQAYTRLHNQFTLSVLLEIQTLLATQEEQPLQVERRAGELRILNAWCHAGYWDHLGR
ncbi:hypothetical protein HPB51_000335 [Rhipicephalus microplus]|uniref:Uncharacterized protein n=1 Tax=Rhipicephalus microplus TaxID=6941 RepID=A0A9J6EQI3_RHIMP|nr:hypothetical protein HPB51_000335 [Rhipicephalus microplus]